MLTQRSQGAPAITHRGNCGNWLELSFHFRKTLHFPMKISYQFCVKRFLCTINIKINSSVVLFAAEVLCGLSFNAAIFFVIRSPLCLCYDVTSDPGAVQTAQGHFLRVAEWKITKFGSWDYTASWEGDLDIPGGCWWPIRIQYLPKQKSPVDIALIID